MKVRGRRTLGGSRWFGGGCCVVGWWDSRSLLWLFSFGGLWCAYPWAPCGSWSCRSFCRTWWAPGRWDCVEIEGGQTVGYFDCRVEDRVRANLNPRAVKGRRVGILASWDFMKWIRRYFVPSIYFPFVVRKWRFQRLPSIACSNTVEISLKSWKTIQLIQLFPVLFTMKNKPQRAVPRNHELELPPSYILSIRNPPVINTSPSQWPISQQIRVARLAVPLNLRPNRCKQLP